MNSTPATSSASLIAIRVRTWPEGTPSMTSILCRVAVPTDEAADKSAALQRSKALAARI